jgi:hypothetical protein
MKRNTTSGGQFLTIAMIAILSWGFLYAQSSADVTVLKGLAPVTALMNTSAGKAALGANFSVTGGIQRGHDYAADIIAVC